MLWEGEVWCGEVGDTGEGRGCVVRWGTLVN